MQLTEAQAARLWGVEPTACRSVVELLVGAVVSSADSQRSNREGGAVARYARARLALNSSAARSDASRTRNPIFG